MFHNRIPEDYGTPIKWSKLTPNRNDSTLLATLCCLGGLGLSASCSGTQTPRPILALVVKRPPSSCRRFALALKEHANNRNAKMCKWFIDRSSYQQLQPEPIAATLRVATAVSSNWESGCSWMLSAILNKLQTWWRTQKQKHKPLYIPFPWERKNVQGQRLVHCKADVHSVHSQPKTCFSVHVNSFQDSFSEYISTSWCHFLSYGFETSGSCSKMSFFAELQGSVFVQFALRILSIRSNRQKNPWYRPCHSLQFQADQGCEEVFHRRMKISETFTKYSQCQKLFPYVSICFHDIPLVLPLCLPCVPPAPMCLPSVPALRRSLCRSAGSLVLLPGAATSKEPLKQLKKDKKLGTCWNSVWTAGKKKHQIEINRI